MSDQLKLATVGVGATVAAYVIYNGFIRWQKNRIPAKWRKVGTLVDIMCFPVKSLGVIHLKSSGCEILGLCQDMLRDRVFMVVDGKGSFITARAYPELTQISPSVKGSELILEAAGQDPVRIDINNLYDLPRIMSRVWDHVVETVDCGDEVAEWLTNYITSGSELKPRLVFYPKEYSVRDVKPKNRVFEKMKMKDAGAFPDFTSYNLIAQASVDELNTRLQKNVTPLFFRPNFVVEGSTAYEEDSWDWIRMGEVVFRNTKPCTRCIFTTIDPETGVKDKAMEPLKTLKKYRQIVDPKIRPSVGDSPMMGIHLSLQVPGSVKLGDPVYVNIA